MMSNDSMVQLLVLLAGVIGIIVVILIIVWFTIRAKEKRIYTKSVKNTL